VERILQACLEKYSKPYELVLYGTVCSEAIPGGGEGRTWDCSYFMTRVIRDILRDQSWGRGGNAALTTSSGIWRYLTAPRPSLVGWSIPLIGLSDSHLSTYWNSAHIAFLYGAVTGKDSKMSATLSRVLDLSSVEIPYSVRIHPLSEWFESTDPETVPLWNPAEQERPEDRFCYIVGQWLCEPLIRLRSDGFNLSDKRTIQPIP